MSQKAIYKKALSSIIIFLLSIGLSLTADTHSYAQYLTSYYSAYASPWSTPYSNYITPGFNSFDYSYGLY
ncbi:MAG: hypothetical protein ACMUIA_05730, partial [bacterium]